MLADEPGIEPAGAAESAGDAHEMWLSSDEPPDVVLVDYHLPDEDGLSLCLWLKTTDEPPAVVIYSASADETLALPAVVAGADGLVGKSSDPDEVSDVVRAAAAGERRLPPVSRRSPPTSARASRRTTCRSSACCATGSRPTRSRPPWASTAARSPSGAGRCSSS